MNPLHIQPWLSNELKQRGVTHPELLDELLDHYLEESDRLMSDNSIENTQLKIQKLLDANDFVSANKETTSILKNDNKRLKRTLCLAAVSLIIILMNTPISTSEPPSIWPTNGSEIDIVSGYEWRLHPIHKVKQFHWGLDIRADMGQEVFATSGGTIIESTYSGRHGHYVVIQHDPIYTSKYSHLSERLVTNGDQIRKGTIIGKVGTSGLATAPHLHYEVLKEGKRVNPIDYLNP